MRRARAKGLARNGQPTKYIQLRWSPRFHHRVTRMARANGLHLTEFITRVVGVAVSPVPKPERGEG